MLAEAGADPATLDLLSVLRRNGPPYRLTTRELTDRMMVTAGAVSQRLSRAEKEGLVEREPSATAGSRAVDVQLTPAGHELVERLVDVVLGREAELIGGMDPQQREALTELLRKFLADLHDTLGEQPPSHVGGDRI